MTDPHEQATSSPNPGPFDLAGRVFVVHTVDLANIEAIGFDMDYTLCRYKPSLEVLATELAVDHLVRRGYPKALRDLRFDPAWGIRGLIIDTQLGNVVKMDMHRHVTRAWHGLTPLDDEARRATYAQDPLRLSRERWAMTDTLFSTPESFLFAHMVSLLEAEGGRPLEPHETRRLYVDIRYCIDLVHRDDSLKSRVRADKPRYITRDPQLPHTLHRLRSSGKKLFLLTNSEMSYTEDIMAWLLEGSSSVAGYSSWADFFETSWVEAAKPRFFETEAEPFEVDSRRRIYAGGSRVQLEKVLGVGGDRVVYVGDHIYGDVLKSRTNTGWRTVLVVPELEHELPLLEANRGAILERTELEDERFELEARLAGAELSLQAVRRAERHGGTEDLVDLVVPGLGPTRLDTPEGLRAARESLRSEVAQTREMLEQNLERSRALTQTIEAPFNPRWGQVLNERQTASWFGAQVKLYAGLYTSRVSNLATYSPSQRFVPPREMMAHERVLRAQRATERAAEGDDTPGPQG
jgi:HAD superfamily 5'-nucleotidase-like hydrolase